MNTEDCSCINSAEDSLQAPDSHGRYELKLFFKGKNMTHFMDSTHCILLVYQLMDLCLFYTMQYDGIYATTCLSLDGAGMIYDTLKAMGYRMIFTHDDCVGH